MKFLIKKTFLFLLFSVIVSCSNFTFVYDNKKTEIPIKNETLVSVSGDKTNIIGLYLNKTIGKASNPNFKLKIISEQSEFNLVTKDNQVVTVINLQYNINYVLESIVDRCVIINKSILTEASYDKKSSGYNFGSDLSKLNLAEELVEENIDKFFDYLKNNQESLNCKS